MSVTETPDVLRVPEPAAVQESVAMMLGRDVQVTDAGPNPPEDAIPAAVGVFLDESDRVCGCAWVDLGLGAAIGAAMSMVERDAADDCLASGVLPAEFQGNLREVLVVASSLFGVATAPRIRDLELLETGLADDTLALLADPRRAGFYRVEVADYGSGLISFTLA